MSSIFSCGNLSVMVQAVAIACSSIGVLLLTKKK